MFKKKSLILFLLVLPFFLSFISANTSLTPVQLNACSNIIQSISNATFCNLNLYYPNQSLVLNNVSMTKIGDVYNYTFCSNIVSGDYIYITQCNPNNLIGDPIPSDYIVNGYGSNVSTSQILGYGFLLAIFFVILGVTIYYANKIPFSNNRDEEGKFLSINDFKYVKIVLYVFAYLEFLGIMSIAKNMALGYLLNDGIYQFFNIIYTLMLIALIPFFPCLIAFTVIVWLSDKKNLRDMQRGILE